MQRLAALLSILALSSCGAVPGVMSEKEFSKKYAEQLCDRTFDCDETGATEFWGSEDDCHTETKKELKASYDNECSYNGDLAKDCLNSFKELSCNPHYEIIQAHLDLCESIWECGE